MYKPRVEYLGTLRVLGAPVRFGSGLLRCLYLSRKEAKEGDAVFFIDSNPDRTFARDLKNAGIDKVDGLNRKVDFHALRYTFCTMLARQGTSQRMAQELMRHSDPHLTAQIYTDVSQLPTFDAVSTLPWHEVKDAQIDSQNSVAEGQNESQTGTYNGLRISSEIIDFQDFSPELACPGTDGRMAEREGLLRHLHPQGGFRQTH